LSAAATVDETLRWLGLDPERHREAVVRAESDWVEEDESAGGPAAPRMPALAWSLARELDCAVLAMRFPVGDEFAIDLGRAVYHGVLNQRQTLDQAIQRALPALLQDSDVGAKRYPPLSQVTPALFGRRAAGLALTPSRRDPSFEVSAAGLAHFPPPEERLVGRVDVLSQANRALASQSGQTGLLLYGMAGGGKSTCAKELAWQHEDIDRFQAFVWYQAPEVDKDISTALTRFATALEDQAPGLKMVDKIDRPEELRRWLPRLCEVLRQHSILIVLDNLESLEVASCALPAQ